MADEIVNKLGFDVQDALSALQKLDSQLQSSASSFSAHAGAMQSWNSTAQTALATMREMATLASKMTLPTVGGAATATSAASASVATPETLSRIQSAIALTSQYGGKVSVVGDQLRMTGMKGEEALNRANNAAKNFSISLSMLGRIVVTQMIVRALSQVRQALSDATESAIDFQRQIAEISTIAPVTASFQTLSDEVAEMSKKFNIPLPQVAEGLYETISDQFTTVTERNNIMQAAMKLSRVAVMDLGSSVELLTGTLNAYGMSSDQAATVAAKFFRTIELGRVRGKELSDTIGQVIPIAAQLKVSLDEVNSAYVSMTIGGLDAHKAATGLRQAMVAIIKPSEEMKKTMRSMGFTDPEQMIAAKGLIGSFEGITKASHGMAGEIGENVRNIRAMTAVLSLGRDEAEKYKAAQEVMAKTTADTLDQIYEQFTKMPAEKLTSNINSLRVTLTRDFGNMIVETLGNMMQWIGGADRMAAAIQGLASAAMILIPVLGALAIAAMAATAGLGPLGIALGAITVAAMTYAGASTYLSAMELAAIRKNAQERRQALIDELRDDAAKRQQRIDDLKKQQRDELKEWENGMSEIRKKHFDLLDKLKEDNKVLIDDARETMSSLIESQERVVSAYRNAAKAQADASRHAHEEQVNGEAAYADAVFTFQQRNKDAYEKTIAAQGRSRQLTNEAVAKMREAKTPEDVAAAQAIQQRADAFAQEAAQQAQATGDTRLQEDAERNILSIMLQKNGAQKKLSAIMAQASMKTAREAAQKQKDLDDSRVLMKQILSDLQSFDKEGPKDPLKLQQQRERLQENLSRLLKLAPPTDISQMLSVDKLQQRVQLAMEGGVSKTQIRELMALPAAIKALHDQIETGVGPITIAIKTAETQLPERLRKELAGLPAEQRYGIYSREMASGMEAISGYEELIGQIADYNKSLIRTNKNAKESLAEAGKKIQEIAQGGPKLSDLFNPRWKEDREDLSRQMARQGSEFMRAAQAFTKIAPEKTTEKDFLQLKKSYEKYLDSVKPPKELKAQYDQFMQDAGAQADAAKKAMQLQQELPRAKAKATEAQEIQRILQELKNSATQAVQPIDQGKSAAAAAASSLSQVAQLDMSGLVNQISAAAAQMWSLASASRSVKTPSATGTEYAARGGRIGRYLAAGGPAGTDVIPAWLSKGEFVMNAGATQKFASQLIAMNAGVQPVYRNDGGNVTTSIGDINVTVQGGDTGRQTAKSIASELNRLVRRGVVTLK